MYQGRMVYFDVDDFGGHDHFTEEEYNGMSVDDKATIEVYPPDPDDPDDTTEYARRRPRTFHLLELSDEQIAILTNNYQRILSGGHTSQDHRPVSERPQKCISECKPWQNDVGLSDCRRLGIWSCMDFDDFNTNRWS